MKNTEQMHNFFHFRKENHADMICWRRNVTFVNHFHKSEGEKKKVLSEVAHNLNKEKYNNGTMLKENSKWQSFSKKSEDACAVTHCNDGIKKVLADAVETH